MTGGSCGKTGQRHTYKGDLHQHGSHPLSQVDKKEPNQASRPRCAQGHTGRKGRTNGGALTLEEELDAASMYDPLQLASSLASQIPPEGWKAQKHPCTTARCQSASRPLTLAQVDILPKMSPVTDQEE